MSKWRLGHNSNYFLVGNDMSGSKLYLATGQNYNDFYQLYADEDYLRFGKQSGGNWTECWSVALKSDLPQSGRTPLIDCESNAITEFKVTFSKAFSEAPAIIVTPSSGTPGINGIPKYSAWNVTTTGFTIRIYNDDSEQRSPAFYWIAMAQS